MQLFALTTIFIFLITLANGQWWDQHGMMDWDNMGGMMGGHHGGQGDDAEDCAVSCFTSAYPSDSTSWHHACVTPTAVSRCIASSCSDAESVHQTIVSLQSSMCSMYSRCWSGVQNQDQPSTCGAWGFWGPCTAGWDGGHDNGWYTVTGTASQTSGWTTTTQVLTTTASDGSISAVSTTKTATIIAAPAQTTAQTPLPSETATPTSGSSAAPMVSRLTLFMSSIMGIVLLGVALVL